MSKKSLFSLFCASSLGLLFSNFTYAATWDASISPLFVWIPLIGFFFSAFWIWMFIDVVRFEHKSKALWLLVLFFWSTIWAFVYYFWVKKPRDASLLVAQPTPVAPQTPVVTSVVETPTAPVVVPEQAPQVVAQSTPEPVVVAANPVPEVIDLNSISVAEGTVQPSPFSTPSTPVS